MIMKLLRLIPLGRPEWGNVGGEVVSLKPPGKGGGASGGWGGPVRRAGGKRPTAETRKTKQKGHRRGPPGEHRETEQEAPQWRNERHGGRAWTQKGTDR